MEGIGAESALGGRYILGPPLGRGGMSTVYRGWDTKLRCWRAIKMLAPSLLGDAELLARFETEARAMAALNHPNLVRVLDVEHNEFGPYIVMEFIDAVHLGTWIRRHGPLPPRVATDLAVSVAEGLSHAHAHGVVHRDVKPSNVLVDAEGVPKLIDFGIAETRDSSGRLASGRVLGTTGFMPPEQRIGGATGPAGDQYGLAATLYTLLLAARPVDLFALHLREQVLGALPVPLQSVIMRATAYQAADRYPSVAAMRDAMVEARPHLPPPPANMPSLHIPAPRASTTGTGSLSSAASRPRSGSHPSGATLRPAVPAMGGQVTGRTGIVAFVLGIAALALATLVLLLATGVILATLVVEERPTAAEDRRQPVASAVRTPAVPTPAVEAPPIADPPNVEAIDGSGDPARRRGSPGRSPPRDEARPPSTPSPIAAAIEAPDLDPPDPPAVDDPRSTAEAPAEGALPPEGAPLPDAQPQAAAPGSPAPEPAPLEVPAPQVAPPQVPPPAAPVPAAPLGLYAAASSTYPFDRAALRAVFTGRHHQWGDGTQVVVILAVEDDQVMDWIGGLTGPQRAGHAGRPAGVGVPGKHRLRRGRHRRWRPRRPRSTPRGHRRAARKRPLH